MSLVDCLHQAIKAVRTSDLLEEGQRAAFVEGLERVIQDNTKSEARQVAALINTLREGRKQAYIAAVSKKMDEASTVRLQMETEKLPVGERLTFLRRFLEADIHTDRQGQGATVSSLLRVEESTNVGKLHPVFDALTTRWLNRDTKMAEDFLKEALGLDSANPRARELLTMYRQTEDALVKRARAAGVYMSSQPNYFPRAHSAAKIVAELPQWRTWMHENLDPKHHPDPGASADRIYASLMTTDLNAQTETTLSLSREVFFKTPEADREYFYRFGSGTVGEAAFEHIRELSRKVVLAEQIAPTPLAVIHAVLKPLRKEVRVASTKATSQKAGATKEAAKAGNPKEKAEAARRVREAEASIKMLEADERQGGRIEMIATSMTGALHNPANQGLANWGAATRNWAVFEMLGKVALSLVGTDALNSVFQNSFHTGGFASSFGKTLHAAAQVVGNKNMRAFAEDMGVWTHALHAATIDRLTSTYATSGTTRSVTRQMATGAQRASGVYLLDNILRSASMVVMSRALMRASQRDWKDIDARYQKALRNNGIDPAKWSRLRANIKPQDSLGTVDVAKLPRDLRDLVMGFFYRELDLAVVHPQHYDRAVMLFGGQAGTASGELAAMTTQFMSWPIAFMRGPVRRVLSEGKLPFIGYAAGMTMAGAMTTQLYEMAENRPTFEWDSPTLWARALVRSGLYSPLGGLLMDLITGERDPDISGPAISLILQNVGGLTKAGRALIDGETDIAARHIAQTIQHTVVPNHWLLQYSLTSRVMAEVEQTLDPEYYRAKQRRLADEGRNL